MRARGVDVSHWQPLLSKALVTPYRLGFVAIKATEGSGYNDPYFSTNWARAPRYGLRRSAYHFARPEQSSARQQAKRVLDRAKPKGTDAILLDLEASKLTQAHTREWRDEFADYVRARAPLDIYMGFGYCTNGTGRNAARKCRHHWFSRYPGRTSFPAVFNPVYLASAKTNTGFTSGPHVWQFTDHLGGRTLDGDVSRRTIIDLAGGKPAPAQEADMQLSDQVKLNPWIKDSWLGDDGL